MCAARGCYRWHNQLIPGLKKDPFTPAEDRLIVQVNF